jgi:hypothetical protein
VEKPVVRKWIDAQALKPGERALVEVPAEHAAGLLAVVSLSDEYRHCGLLVTNVGPDSPAAHAGMTRGDVLLRYAGVELDSPATLRRLERRQAQGGRQLAKIEALRAELEIEFETAGGRLGVTVAPLLHRLTLPERRPSSGKGRAWGFQWRPLVREVVFARTPGDPVLIDVPGDLAGNVLLLMRRLETANSRQKKMIKALLTTAAMLAAG